ncbi:MAG: class I SAM-dependent methyltransferase [Anaerolineales bacterium]
MRWFLAFFFRELYTRLAWFYDAVAMITSVGSWFTWQGTAYEALPGEPVIELGFGTGHVQADLASRGWQTIGIDVSPQMARIGQRRLLGRQLPPRLVLADARALPFANAIFRSAVSTFPSEYLYESGTLREARRVLRRDGRLVVIPMAQITGRGPIHRLAGWLYRFTGQSGPVTPAWTEGFRDAGFEAKVETVTLPRSNVIRIVASVSSLGASPADV